MTYDNEGGDVVLSLNEYKDRQIESMGRVPDHIQGLSEDSLAVGFADEHISKFRYVGQWHRWMTWNGTKWEFDYMSKAYNAARQYMRTIAKRISDKVFKDEIAKISPHSPNEIIKRKRADARDEGRRAVKPLLSMKTIHSVAKLTTYDSRIAMGVDAWDSDPYLLNTPTGTIDLRTGAARPHSPFDYMTCSTAIGPAAGTPQLWLSFLHKIMHDDDEMVRYLQKVFGYCLVGDIKEHQMYFGYGTGANGKGVALNTMRSILGDYGIEANIETFIVTGSQRHPTELAALRGARLVTCGETDEGQRWAEARIKKMTGGDPIRAHFMRQDEFEYIPQFKLFLAGNHKPKLRNVDEAIERRFRLIPFTYTVPKADRDLDLGEKLRAEWPQILNWAIEGCLLWQTEGLTPPPAVADATRSYLSQEDAISAWFGECCIQNPDAFTPLKDLYKSWVEWSQECGEPYGPKRQLSIHLEDREPVFKIRRTRRGADGIVFAGVELAQHPGKGE